MYSYLHELSFLLNNIGHMAKNERSNPMKSTRSRFQLFGVILLLFLTVFLAGCSKTVESGEKSADAPPPTSAAPAAVPSAAPDHGPQLNMFDVIPMEGVDASLVVCDVEEITENDKIIGVGQKVINPWIFVKNTGAEPITVMKDYFVLVDDNGNEYEASYDTPGNLWGGVTLLPGGIIEGPIYFIVPEHAEPYSLKASADLNRSGGNMVEIDLREYAEYPGDEVFTAKRTSFYETAVFVDFDTVFIYDDKLALQVTDSYFTESNEYEPCGGYRFFQAALTVENLTDEELNVTLDYSYYLYSAGYSHLLKQIPLPFADNELWVETLAAKEARDFVITFEIMEDSSANYLFVQDFFENRDPVFFNLKAQ